MKKQKPMMRGAGVLLPVSCLPSPYGIGTFGDEAFAFVDFLDAARQSYWQVLPLGPTSYGDSPYQSFSAFAGNPYFIDLMTLVRQGLVRQKELDSNDWGDDATDIDYAALYKARFVVLRLAYSRSHHQDTVDYNRFTKENDNWLPDYCLFMALKTLHEGREWQAWPAPLRLREPVAIAKVQKEQQEEMAFWGFCQYLFDQQWQKLKVFANEHGIAIIGDIPIYVAMDSADVWVHGDLFQLDNDKKPTAVAGVPPDMFSATGQLWGNPLYNWERMAEDGFDWWKQRMAASARLYDVIRIDHFIGVVNYYAIPATDDTAMNGSWQKGPGMALMEAITTALGGKRIIAEDLGVITPPVRKLLEKCGYPSMKLMQFAFENNSKNHFLPCHYDKNMVIYGGTHDNETLAGFFGHQSRKVLRFARDYLGVTRNSEIPEAIVRTGYESSANTTIFLLQDLMGLDNRARINTPSTIGINWRWRLAPGEEMDATLAQNLAAMVEVYGR